MRRPAVLAVVLAAGTSGAAVGAVGGLRAERRSGHPHAAPSLARGAAGAPIGWVARVSTATLPATTSTPTGTATGPTTTPTTTTDPGPQPPPTTLPRRTGVQLDDTPAFTLAITRNPVAAGSVEITATNVGEDDHDLTVRRGDGAPFASTGTVASQGQAVLTLDLDAGDYTVYCSLPGHEASGMKGTLRVR